MNLQPRNPARSKNRRRPLKETGSRVGNARRIFKAAADHKCVEGSAALDQLIEHALLQDSLARDGERLRILNRFSRLSGVHDCSDILSRN